MYKIIVDGKEFELCYEEMVEIIYGFLMNSRFGNEFYEDALKKARLIASNIPETSY